MVKTTARKMMTKPATPLEAEHTPVMLREVLDLLRCHSGGIYVDATVGTGGHAAAILEGCQPDGLLIGIDRDRESLEKASKRLTAYAGNFRLFHDNFKNLPLIINNLALGPVDGILVDLGVSSYQLLTPERGFTFQIDAYLDMRMDRSQQGTAADLLNRLPESELADLLYRYGEERFSRRIAAAVVRERARKPITRTSQLVEIISSLLPSRGPQRIHLATRTFQALRIAVNQELEGLEKFLTEAFAYLKAGGRMVVIAFHSLEDRIVKRAFRMLAGRCVCEAPSELCSCPKQVVGGILTPRPMTPSPEELAANPRSRSARLRAMERI